MYKNRIIGHLDRIWPYQILARVKDIKTNPGLVEEDYYEKGRYHDANYQKKMTARSRLGWNISLQTPDNSSANSKT